MTHHLPIRTKVIFNRLSGEQWFAIDIEGEISPVKADEVNKALEIMQRGKAAGEDQITTDLLKDGGQIVLEKLATLYRHCLMISTILESWKNANIILIDKKGDVKDFKIIDQLTHSRLPTKHLQR